MERHSPGGRIALRRCNGNSREESGMLAAWSIHGTLEYDARTKGWRIRDGRGNVRWEVELERGPVAYADDRKDAMTWLMRWWDALARGGMWAERALRRLEGGHEAAIEATQTDRNDTGRGKWSATRS